MAHLRTYIVEDSPVIRENLIATLEEMVPVEVIGTAEDESSAAQWLGKSDKAACAKMDGNAKDVCSAEAKAKEKVALADLDYKKSGKDSDRIKAAKVKAEQDYAVAKEKCEDKSVTDKGACKKEAKAAEDKAMADLKAEKKVASKG